MTSLNLQPLQDYLAGKQAIRFAYLFGSCAKRNENPLSDVDVAVYADDSLDFFSFRLNIMEELARVIGGRHLDLIVLNESALLLQYEVIRHGIILKDALQQRVEFETRVLRNYLDTEPLRTAYIDAVKKSFVREGQIGQ